MPSILEIQQDAQNVVRLSTVGLDTLNKLELDTITYNVVDKNGAIKRSYEGRNIDRLLMTMLIIVTLHKKTELLFT